MTNFLIAKKPEKGEVENRTLSRIPVPRLRPHTVKGKSYYFYCDGTGRELYLGSADSILASHIKANTKE